MAWGKVDDGLHSSLKWRTASRPARALWVTALSWCMDELTDGFVPAHVLPMLDGTKRDAASLVTAGLWEQVDGGWIFHDWHDYQPTSEQVKAERERKATNQKAYRDRKKGTRVTGHVAGNAPGESPRTFRGRSGVPEPQVGTGSREGAGSRAATHRHAIDEDSPNAPRETTSIPSSLLPTTWTPNTVHKAYALQHGIKLDRAVEKFRGRMRSKRITSFDWDAEFDAWLSDETKFAERTAAEPPRPGSSVWSHDITGQGANA